MQYHNPLNIPKPERPNNPSPLELAIYSYEVKAREFHIEKSKMAADDESVSDIELRILKSKRNWEHLRLERRKLQHILCCKKNLSNIGQVTSQNQLKI